MSALARSALWYLGAGSRTTVVTQQVATMIDAGDQELAERLWIAQCLSGADGALELLLEGGIGAVPDFVLIEVEGDAYRILVRGKAKVVVGGSDGARTFEGVNVRLCSEHVVIAPTWVCAGFVDTLPDLGERRPHESGTAAQSPNPLNAQFAIESGFGLFDWMAVADGPRIAFDQTEPGATAGVSGPQNPLTPHLAVVDEQLHASSTSTGAQDDPQRPVGDPAGDAQPTSGDSSSADVAADTPNVATSGEIGRGGTHADPAGDHDTPDHKAGLDVVTGEREATDQIDTSVAAIEPHGENDRYSSIFGATVQRSVIDAAVRDSNADGIETDGGETAEPVGLRDADDLGTSHGLLDSADDPHEAILDVAHGDDSGHSSPPDETLSAAEVDVNSPPHSGGAIVDHTLPPDHDERRNSIATPLGDHDGRTISRADLPVRDPSDDHYSNEFASSAATRVDGHGGPTVQSIRCERGHDNPPQRSECARCGLSVEGQPVTIPRPPLGTLTFSTGVEVVLDRPVLVGRKPSIAGRTVSEIPREVAIDVGDGLSRSHALFTIAEWQVRVEDLGSTNHTTVRLPDQPTQRLRTGEPVPISDGTVIDLGGEVTCRYDFTF